jgi:WD40 repeat protein
LLVEPESCPHVRSLGIQARLQDSAGCNAADCRGLGLLRSGRQQASACTPPRRRLWDLESGACLQVLEGHTDEIFSCAFNYEGDTLISGSKDNTCRIWRV